MAPMTELLRELALVAGGGCLVAALGLGWGLLAAVGIVLVVHGWAP